MRISWIVTIGLCVLLAGALQAQQLEGKDAPDFTMGGVVNGVADVPKADLAGQVIVIKVWGIT